MFWILAALLFDPIQELSIVQEELNQQLPGSIWNCEEIGTGNINFIYLANNGDRKVIVKKDLDFARINPEEFPLPLERLLYEYRAYVLYKKMVPEYVPEIYFFDFDRGMLAMEYLFPHLLLRQGILKGEKYPFLAEHLGVFLARSLYFSSCYHLSKGELEENMALFSENKAMRQIICDLNFTDPFYGSPLNHWTAPELDEIAEDLQTDLRIKTVVDEMKEKFLNTPEALSHGDLHTGSILVTSTDTKMIDAEFASYAPISFDIGMLLGNLVMATFSADAHSIDRIWLAKTTVQIWDVFEEEFRKLWKCAEVNVEQKLQEIWIDTLRLMGIEICRRTIGVAHSADFETIGDRALKASIEKKALLFAKELLLKADDEFFDSKALECRLSQDSMSYFN